MGFKNLSELGDLHLDVLREIGNIGSGNAATSLSSMLNTVVDIEVPKISLTSYDKVTEYLGGREKMMVGLSVGLEEDIQGIMLHVFRPNFIERVVNVFYPKEINSIDDITEMELSAVKEVSNITTAAYVNSMATMTNMFINITPPSEIIGSVEDILVSAARRFDEISDQVIYLEENLFIAGTEIKSSMILMLNIASLEKLFDKLYVPY